MKKNHEKVVVEIELTKSYYDDLKEEVERLGLNFNDVIDNLFYEEGNKIKLAQAGLGLG